MAYQIKLGASASIDDAQIDFAKAIGHVQGVISTPTARLSRKV